MRAKNIDFIQGFNKTLLYSKNIKYLLKWKNLKNGSGFVKKPLQRE